jgi:predicted transcriptional regulator
MIPCIIPKNSTITKLEISMELSSEAPGSNADWPSDLYF